MKDHSRGRQREEMQSASSYHFESTPQRLTSHKSHKNLTTEAISRKTTPRRRAASAVKKMKRQTTEEEIKKIYGVRKVEKETKHLDIMVEMAQAASKIAASHRSQNHSMSSEEID